MVRRCARSVQQLEISCVTSFYRGNARSRTFQGGRRKECQRAVISGDTRLLQSYGDLKKLLRRVVRKPICARLHRRAAQTPDRFLEIPNVCDFMVADPAEVGVDASNRAWAKHARKHRI